MTFQAKMGETPLHIYITLHQGLRPHMPVIQPALSYCTSFDAQDIPIGLMAGRLVGILTADLHNIHMCTEEYALQSENKRTITTSVDGAPIKRTYFLWKTVAYSNIEEMDSSGNFSMRSSRWSCRFQNILLGHLTSMRRSGVAGSAIRCRQFPRVSQHERRDHENIDLDEFIDGTIPIIVNAKVGPASPKCPDFTATLTTTLLHASSRRHGAHQSRRPR